MMEVELAKCCICDACQLWPFVNIRFHSWWCEDFNLCEVCHHKHGLELPSPHQSNPSSVAVHTENTQDHVSLERASGCIQPSFSKPSDARWSYRGQESFREKLEEDWPRRYKIARNCFAWIQKIPMSVDSGMATIFEDIKSKDSSQEIAAEQTAETPYKLDETEVCNGRYPRCLTPKHKIFLSHAGPEKGFVEQLNIDLEGIHHFGVFFDKDGDSLPKGEQFPGRIFEAARNCELGVVVMSDEYFHRKWPMLELAAFVKESRKRESFKILPLFYKLTAAEFKQEDRQKRWFESWNRFSPRIDVQEWKDALKVLAKYNGMSFVSANGDVVYRAEIKEEIWKTVTPYIKEDDSHILGSVRMSKMIEKELGVFDDDRFSSPNSPQPRFIGMYGSGGEGKTTMCKVVCNNLLQAFRGKVCHIELGSKPNPLDLQKQLLQLFLNLEKIDMLVTNVLKGRYLLKEHLPNHCVLLVLDNVWDNVDALEEAKSYLTLPFKKGSIVLVTSRTMETLKRIPVDIKWHKFFEMPVLEVEEARSLLAQSAGCSISSLNSEAEKEELERLLNVCCFNSATKKSRYHPFIIKVLGAKVGNDPSKWKDIMGFKHVINEKRNPFFSRLRLGYDDLPKKTQKMYLDLVLCIGQTHPRPINTKYKTAVDRYFETTWGEDRKSIAGFLQVLQTKALLEKTISEGEDAFYIHDLYIEFAQLEVIEEGLEHEKTCVLKPEGDDRYFQKGRLSIEGGDFTSLAKLNLCSKCNEPDLMNVNNCKKLTNLDLRGMNNLSKLYVATGCSELLKIHVENIPTLHDLFWTSGCSNGFNFPSLAGLVALRKLEIWDCHAYATKEVWGTHDLNGGYTSSSASGTATRSEWPSLIDSVLNLIHSRRKITPAEQIVDFSACTKLEMFRITNVPGIIRLSNLEGLKCVRYLTLYCLPDLVELPDLSCLISLTDMRLRGLPKLNRLLGLHGLSKLGRLDLRTCPLITELPGIELLSELQTVGCWYTSLQGLPNLSRLQKLRALYLVGCERLTGLGSIGALHGLELLDVSNCRNFSKLPAELRTSPLENLNVSGTSVSEIPDIGDYRSLQYLCCANSRMAGLSDLSNLQFLRTVDLSFCLELRCVPKSIALPTLEIFDVRGCAALEYCPDFTNSRALKELYLCPLVDPNSVKLPNEDGQLPREGQQLHGDDTTNKRQLSDGETGTEKKMKRTH
ncbi:hypothetical protein M758_4G098300 [Ceratodon purpureus]|nr:hypothetical protein M758_4G098300 [Ceratodon purpureus]